MPKIKGTTATDKKSYLKVLEVMKLGVPITPTDIDAYIGLGKYSSKYICFLKRLGFQFSAQKDKRNVITYTLIGVPKNSASLQITNPIPAKKSNPAPSPTKKVAAVKITTKNANNTFGPKDTEPPEYSTPPESSFTVDSEFDSVNIDDLEF